jgi:hypothetical protein
VLARQLGEITGLRVIELDKSFWQSGLVETPRQQWVELQQKLVRENEGTGTSDPMTPSKSDFELPTRSSSWTSRSFDARGAR